MTRGVRGPGGGGSRVVAALAELALPLLLLAALNLYAVRFVRAERTLYHADQVAYWSYASELAVGLRARPFSALGAVARSVATRELNLLPALPIAAVMAGFGSSRMVYILAVLDVYGLALILVLLAALRLGGPAARPPPLLRGMVVTTALLLFPTVFRPVLLGYVGLGGVALGIVILAIYLHIDVEDGRWRHLLLLGFLVAMLALYRRWYAIWGLAFILAVAAEACWHLAHGAWRDRARLWSAVRPPLLVATAAAATILLLAAPLLLRRLSGGYGQVFAAYARGDSLLSPLGDVVAELGVLPLAAVAVAVVALLGSRSSRRLAVVLPLQVVLAWLVMTHIQGHSPQHWYLYLPALLLLTVVGLGRILAGATAPTAAAAAGAALLVGALGTVAVLGPLELRLPASMKALLSANRVRPLVRDDLDEVRRLLGDLDRLVAGRAGYIYVLGSGEVLSDQALAFANRSLGSAFSSPPLILASAHVDRRDGFPRGLLQADYVVVPDPPQLGLRPEEQQVVLLPTRSFLDRENVARAFRRLPRQFRLEGGVNVLLFERVRPIADSEVAELCAELRRAHPDLPRVWTP